MIYICKICGWTYDEATGAEECGIPAGTPFDALGEEFVCPQCAAEKQHIESIDSKEVIS